MQSKYVRPRRTCKISASLSHMQKYRRIHRQQHFPRFPLTPLSSSAGPSSPMPKLGVGRPSQLLRLSPCPNLKLPWPSKPGPSKYWPLSVAGVPPASRACSCSNLLLFCSTRLLVRTRKTSSIPSPSLALISWQQSQPMSCPQKPLLRLLSRLCTMLAAPAAIGGVVTCSG